MNIDNETLRRWLDKHEACEPALKWLNGRDLAAAWTECPDGDWVQWAIDVAGMDLAGIVDAWADYIESTDIDLAWAAYSEAIDLAQAAYVNADYGKADAIARAAYNKAIAPARAAYHEATAPARADFADAIRAVYPSPPAELVAAILEAS